MHKLPKHKWSRYEYYPHKTFFILFVAMIKSSNVNKQKKYWK